METSDALCTQYICLETLVLNDRGSTYCLGNAKRSACLQRNISRLRTRLAITLLIVLASFFLVHTTSAAVYCVSTAAELQQILRDTRGDAVADEILIAEGVYSDTRTDGGGVYLLNVDSATFNTNTVEDNTSEGEGGDIYVEDNNGTMTFQNNESRKNHTIGEHGGDGVYVKNGEGNDFGPSGSLTFTENNLIENSAITEGGGIYVYQTQSILITDNQVKLNTSGLEGGGIYLYHHGEVMLSSVAISTDPASMIS